MNPTIPTYEELAAEVAALRIRLADDGEILRAIRHGEVDAVLAQGPHGDQLFTLNSADDPYRVLIEEMNQGAVTLSADGSILYCNRRFGELLETLLEEIVGCTFDTFVAPAERGKFAELLAAGRTRASAADITLFARDKSAVPVQLALSPLPAESDAAICLVATDISESKRVEAELLMGAARLAEAQQSAQVGSWEWDMQAHELRWSDELYRIFRMGRAAVEPSFEAYAELVHPEDVKRVMENVHRALHERSSFDHDHRITRADGTHGVIQSRGHMVLDDAGEPLKFFGTSQDITERKRVEAELAEANRKLRETSRQAGMAEVATSVLHNVENVLNSVNISDAVASEKIRRSCGTDIARVAALLHEHHGDLPGFLVSAQGSKLPAFLTSVGQRLAEEQSAVLSELRSLSANIDHIKEIVSMQQTYARVGAVSEELPLASLADDALRLNAASLDRHGVTVIREYGETPPLSVDRHKVLQILVNLIRNAKHAMDDPGAQGKRMTLRIGHDGAPAKISIADEGVGIPAENLARIFEHGFTTRKEGHGFGLHSAAIAAKELGGSLTVHSDGSGKGAAITLELPCKSGEPRL